MKNRPLSILFILASFSAFSQVNYEKGYFVDLHGQRTECIIKNYEWKNNPVEFEYKVNESDVSHKANVTSVNEFGIDAVSKYMAADVSIDRGGDLPAELTMEKNPVWTKERLFLKVLIESETSLLYYSSGNLRRFFYSSSDTIKQLIYKKYLTEGNDVRENLAFRQQLWADARCGNTSEAEMKQLKYDKADLISYFNSYLKCANTEAVDYTKTARKGSFHLKLAPGINYTTLMVRYGENTQYLNSDVDYGSQTDFRMGLEAEFVLPYNRNKWSIIVEPGYQTFSSANKDGTKVAKYNSFEIPMGVRYHIFLTQKSSIFVNGLFVYSMPQKTSHIQVLDLDLPVSTTGGFAVGAGFDFKKFSGEIRFNKYNDILNDYLYWTTDFSRLSFILGFRLF